MVLLRRIVLRSTVHFETETCTVIVYVTVSYLGTLVLRATYDLTVNLSVKPKRVLCNHRSTTE